MRTMTAMLAALLLCLGAAGALAQRVDRLPAGASELRVHGQAYYYASGYFYRETQDGYLRVEPPLGAQIDTLPPGGTGFQIGSEQYFLTGNGTFYLYNSNRDDFTVVPPPYNWRNYYRDPDAPEVPVYPRAYPTSPEAEFNPRAAREAVCEQVAREAVRRQSTASGAESRKLRIYRREYLRCLQENRGPN